MPLLGFEPAILLLERPVTLVVLAREVTESKYCALWYTLCRHLGSVFWNSACSNRY